MLGGENFPSLKVIFKYRGKFLVIITHNFFLALKALREYLAPGHSTTKFYNVYGVTEVSCWATIAFVDLQEDESTGQEIDLGRPLRNTILRVVNDLGDEVTEGEGKTNKYCMYLHFS